QRVEPTSTTPSESQWVLCLRIKPLMKSRAHVPALQAPLSTSRGWRKRKCATTTDDDGYRRWQAFIVRWPRSSPTCPSVIRITTAPSRLRRGRTPVLQNGDASITVVDLAGKRSHFNDVTLES